MFYKQLNSAGQLVSVGQTIDGTNLPENFIEIPKAEYDSFQRVLNIPLQEVKLTPLTAEGEILFIE